MAAVKRVAPPEVTVVAYPEKEVPSHWKRKFLLFISALRSDHLLIDFNFSDVALFSLGLFLFPFHRCRITTLDFFVRDPSEKTKPFVSWALSRVSRFLVYFRDSSRLQALFRLPASKFCFVPFKINGYEIIRSLTPRDEGYVFSGGRSRRDFATFFQAVEPSGYPVKLFTGDSSALAPHGSSLEGLTIPPNVEILNTESSAQAFLRTMAGARIVVIPLLRDSHTQAGIGVYIQAMALRKCVIISASLGVSDVLTEGQAAIVPAGDPSALRQAIEKLWNDDALREQYAEAGFRYASALGGEDDLARRLLNQLPQPAVSAP